ncbi:hypothetical protein P4V47_06850 [Brevibacillus laterosporus]|uniref:hypothetical protein n=1 Tax=Brevibacillus laterosporus TaxID=1465 RepID=UPI0018CDBB6A|nr:hypothetical protein [Brevibacillus laterosporus]MED1787228.1 hypothetical protein [Brevibacillus laterosporus]
MQLKALASKKLFTTLLAICMLFSLATLAFAASGTYSLNEKKKKKWHNLQLIELKSM